MDSLFFHPKVVHVPMALAVLMPLLAVVFVVAWWRGWFPAKTWWVAVGLQAILVISGFIAMRTGEAEEHKVEAAGVSHDAIEHHEHEAARFVYVAAGVLALMAAAGVLQKKKAGLPLAAASIVGTGVVLMMGIGAGHHGGELVYEHNAGAAYSTPAQK